MDLITNVFIDTWWAVATQLTQLIVPIIAIGVLFSIVHKLLK